ncbi:hypothetical protein [uncultured Eubacterium sp.]|mgnify:FL=1|uniref:hypothetical protein n=1 Tax=uncultured Eubacterium sp. TaxID=165185 RepID=UPI002598A074|nr:hypothetical protein [uncultured Eubacterium sp.]
MDKNNLQSIWDDLDLAYEHMERAIENLSETNGLSVELMEMVERYDLSEIRILKQEVEELMEAM